MNIDIARIGKALKKVKRKSPALFIAVNKKIAQIASMDITAVEHFKNLRHDLSHLKRVQIGSFVLTFRVKGNVVIFEDFNHHDHIYIKES